MSRELTERPGTTKKAFTEEDKSCDEALTKVVNGQQQRLQDGHQLVRLCDEERCRWLGRGCFNLLYDWTKKRTVASLEVLNREYLERGRNTGKKDRPPWTDDKDEAGDVIPPVPDLIDGYERGHLAAFGNHNITRENAIKTCIKTNSFLQIKGDRAYAELEEWIRKYVKEFEDIFIITYVSNTNELATDSNGTQIQAPEHTIKILECNNPRKYSNIQSAWFPFFLPNDKSMQAFPQNSGQYITNWDVLNLPEFHIQTPKLLLVHPLKIIEKEHWKKAREKTLEEVNSYMENKISILFQPFPNASISARICLPGIELRLPDQILWPSEKICSMRYFCNENRSVHRDDILLCTPRIAVNDQQSNDEKRVPKKAFAN